MLKHGLVTLAVLMALSALVVAGCSRTPEQRAEHFVKHMASELKLNDTQRAQLEKIKDEFLARRPKMEKLREESVKEANELMLSAEIDKSKLDALVRKNTAQLDDFVHFIFAKFAEIHDLLTPEQRVRLVSLIEKRMERRHENRETGMGSSSGGY
jgi:Spy/CpxP family protein refolding chaperone